MNKARLQEDLIKAAKNGDVDNMIKLIKEGADPLKSDDGGDPIISYLSQSNVEEEKLREFIKFLAPYNYTKE
ncbi:MAG TPA: hypothetical protein QKA08_01380 [Candidatus Megaira endosymbiont of Nemacystus decipiens]|nr:hypothetical protein [Candidatus Megaera endosymbiont of Nemacystus decipiens]